MLAKDLSAQKGYTALSGTYVLLDAPYNILSKLIERAVLHDALQNKLTVILHANKVT